MIQTKVEYRETEKIERLLNDSGMRILKSALDIIQDEAAKHHLSLEKIIVSRYDDPEIPDWSHVLITLDFGEPDFDTANGYLESLYPALDEFALFLDNKSKEILNLFIYDLPHF